MTFDRYGTYKLSQAVKYALENAQEFDTTADPARLNPLKKELINSLSIEIPAILSRHRDSITRENENGEVEYFIRALNEADRAIQKFLRAVPKGKF